MALGCSAALIWAVQRADKGSHPPLRCDTCWSYFCVRALARGA